MVSQCIHEIVNDSRFDIQFIVPRTETKDKTLLNYSKQYKIEYLILDSVNSKASLNKIKSFNCDLLVSMSFNPNFQRRFNKSYAYWNNQLSCW